MEKSQRWHGCIPQSPKFEKHSTLGSPAQRLLSRQTRSAIPVNSKLLEPTPKHAQIVTAQLLHKRMTQKRYYDASSHPLQPLTEGQVVRMQTPKGYNHRGTVKEVNKEPRSYTIQCNGRTYRRNRRHIFPSESPLLHGLPLWTLTIKIP